MSYREFRPPPALRSVVECGWNARIAAGAPSQRGDVLPDGCMDLVWTGGELLVAGPDTGPHPFRRDPGAPAVGLRFAPGGMPGLLGVPADELRDARIPLAQLHPGPAGRAVEQLADDTDAGEMGRVLVDTVAALAGVPSAPAGRASRRAPRMVGGAGVLTAGLDPAVALVAGRLGRGAGVGATADALGWTTRTLHRRCLATFGYGPGVLRRILRFRRAVALLRHGVAPATVAARAGYADQPHLSREVRALAGVAPAQLASGAYRSMPVPSGSRTTA